MKRILLPLNALTAPIRVDRWLAQQVPGLGRRQAKELCERGRVQLRGHPVAKSALLTPGDEQLSVDLTDQLLSTESPRAQPEVSLDIAFENDDVVIVNKPAGLPSVAQRRRSTSSVCGALLARYPEMASVGHRRTEPGVVHRLDTQTSGLLIAARSERAFNALTQAIQNAELDKRYLAIIAASSIPDSGRIDVPLGPHPKNRRKVAICAPGDPNATAAVTEYWVQEKLGSLWLVELKAPRAYRHQIRAHLAYVGAPLAGDVLYGGEAQAGLGERHALHAHHVAWTGNPAMAGFSVGSPLPEELRQLLALGG